MENLACDHVISVEPTSSVLLSRERSRRGTWKRFSGRKNIALFDEHGAGEIINQLAPDTKLVRDGLWQKLSLTLYHLGLLVATYIHPEFHILLEASLDPHLAHFLGFDLGGWRQQGCG